MGAEGELAAGVFGGTLGVSAEMERLQALSQLTSLRYLPEAALVSFNVRENAWGLVQVQSLVQCLWGGISQLPGDPPDAVSKVLGWLLHRFLCDRVHASKMTTA